MRDNFKFREFNDILSPNLTAIKSGMRLNNESKRTGTSSNQPYNHLMSQSEFAAQNQFDSPRHAMSHLNVG